MQKPKTESSGHISVWGQSVIVLRARLDGDLERLDGCLFLAPGTKGALLDAELAAG